MALTQVPIELSSTPGIVDNSNATAITIDSSENVGIGTSSPFGPLNVHSASGDTNLYVTTGNTAASTNIFFGDSGNSTIGRIVYDHSGNYMNFRTNGSDAMRIDSNGRVGIGTSPSFPLHVSGASTNYVMSETTGTGTSSGFRLKGDASADFTLFTTQGSNQFAIYDNAKWPDEPLFYANFPSISDPNMAPEGKETCFLLIPIAPGLEDSESLRKKYFDIVFNRLEKLTGQQLRNDILFKESFCVNDFISAYNSYKGNAYGMANTLFQTAFFRPKLKSKKVENLFFSGQLTVPGPGVPPALISGKLVAGLIEKN